MLSRLALAVVLLCACGAPEEVEEVEMPQQTTLKAVGLFTNPNPLGEVPDGAFSLAEDVVVRRPGFVETRRGFRPAPGSFGNSAARVSSFSDFAGVLIAHRTDNVLSRYNASTGVWTDYSGTYAPPEGEVVRFTETAGSLYFTTSAGLYRLDGAELAPVPAGVPQALAGQVATTGSSGFLPVGSQVAYRYVWGYRNANDRLILGAPSSRMTVTNPASASGQRNVLHTVPIPSWVTADYFLQIYRSDVSAGEALPAGDDMALVQEQYPTASEIAAHSLSYTDRTPDELKGAALYTSPNIGIAGPGSDKFEPPVCTDIAAFRGRAWVCNTAQVQRLELTLLSVDSSSGGLGAGSGIILSRGGVREEYRGSTAGESPPNVFRIFTAGTASQNIEDTVRSLVKCINARSSGLAYAHYASDQYDTPGRFYITARTLGSAPIIVTALAAERAWAPALRREIEGDIDSGLGVNRTGGVVEVPSNAFHGLSIGQVVRVDRYKAAGDETAFPPGEKTVASIIDPFTFTYNEAGADAFATDDIFYTTTTPEIATEPSAQPHGLAYSEFGEPDAVPLGNYLTVGSENFPVRRILTLGDSLFVWKDDGLFTISGDSPVTFNVRPFPTALKIQAPHTATVLGSRIFALTDQGVVAVSENGMEVISRPIEQDILAFFSGNAAMAANTKLRAFGVAYETEREYHLWLPGTSSDTSATLAYVYNYGTGAWTRWSKAATAGYVLPGSDLAYLGRPDAPGVLVERKTRTLADYQDADGVPIISAVDWQVRTGNAPGAQKRWVKMTALVEQPDAPASVTLSAYTEISPTRESGEFSLEGLPYAATYIPEDKSRSQVLTCGVQGGEAGKRLALQGLVVDYTVSGTKLR